jgi:hypothetical protein
MPITRASGTFVVQVASLPPYGNDRCALGRNVMSAASLASNYTNRTQDGGGTPSGVPDDLAKQLAQWIPTEALTVYAALLGVLGGTLSKWQSVWLLVGCAVFDILLVWYLTVLKTSKAQTLAQASQPLWSAFRTTKPIGEALLSCLAFVFWVSALPGSAASHLPGWQAAYGSAAVIAAAALVPMLAKAAGILPPPPPPPAAAAA